MKYPQKNEQYEMEFVNWLQTGEPIQTIAQRLNVTDESVSQRFTKLLKERKQRRDEQRNKSNPIREMDEWYTDYCRHRERT